MSTKRIREVAEELNVSVRTLHYYDEMGIVSPSRTKGGYRMYSESDVERLKTVILYRETDMPVRKIERILDDPECDALEVLKGHLSTLLERKEDLDRYIGFTKELIREKESEVVL